MEPPDVSAAVDRHAKELMKIPNVVGVYAGVTNDNRPCIKVMLSRHAADSEKQIPPQLDGIPVITEVTGEIRPMDKR